MPAYYPYIDTFNSLYPPFPPDQENGAGRPAARLPRDAPPPPPGRAPATMDDIQTSEELAFIPEQVETMLYQVITEVIGQSVYDDSKVMGWVDEINDRCMEFLVDMCKPFKYTVTAFIMQKSGAGVHASHACFWDMATDNIAQANWPNEKHRDQHNSRMYVVVTAFGSAITR